MVCEVAPAQHQPADVLTNETPHPAIFPFVGSVRSDQSVLNWNARVLRTGSGQNDPAHGPEPFSSPAAVGQSAGVWQVVAGRNIRHL